jgi:lactoylglutathione lyase
MTIRIEHLALWTTDIERCTAFYTTYFGATPGARYRNGAKGFASVFLTFGGGARLEIMSTSTLDPVVAEAGAQRMGLTHFAVALGSDAAVDTLTARLREDGFPILDGPRRTGDGYYESVTLDPDGNRVELTS